MIGEEEILVTTLCINHYFLSEIYNIYPCSVLIVRFDKFEGATMQYLIVTQKVRGPLKREKRAFRLCG